MENPETKQNDTTPLLIGNQVFVEKTILANENPEKGELLGEIIVEAGSVTPDGGNTGNGVVDQLTLAAGGPAVIGNYNLECITAIADSGVFKLVDPSGKLIANDITIPGGGGGSIVFAGAGITFRITDGATDFVVGDKFTLAVDEGSKKLKVFDETAFDGAQIPKYLFTDTITNAADVEQEVCKVGRVNADKLVLPGSVTLETVINGQSVDDWLRQYGIIAIDTSNLDFYDNQ